MSSILFSTLFNYIRVITIGIYLIKGKETFATTLSICFDFKNASLDFMVIPCCILLIIITKHKRYYVYYCYFVKHVWSGMKRSKVSKKTEFQSYPQCLFFFNLYVCLFYLNFLFVGIPRQNNNNTNHKM